MFYLDTRVWRWIVVTLLIALSAPALISRPSAQIKNRLGGKYGAAFLHDDGVKKKGLSRDQIAREAWVWHQINQQRPEVADAFAPEFINQDVNDISVIQDDGRLVIPANPFDLNGRSVQFAPGISGYSITASNATFDNNLGAKLDMTVAPAVNPKIPSVPGVEAGDDAYILQDLGFSFNFFGATFSTVAVSSNGNLTFRPGGVNQSTFDDGAVSSIASVAEFQQGLPRIAPYWHDLDARAGVTSGSNGVFIRKDSDRVLITWNNIRDFPNDPTIDNGVHRFQVTLFNNGRIVITYDSAQLTSQALAGITPGNSSSVPSLVNLNSPPSSFFTAPVAEFFSTSTTVDVIGVAQAFYATHPNRDVYDFVYMVTDFNFSLGDVDTFAFYASLRNDASGIGQPVGASSAASAINSQRIQGILNLSNISAQYPNSPVTRFLGANHALSVMGQEQGHRWLSYVSFPGNDTLLLGRDDAHWNFFLNIESSTSSPAAPRSSSMEGNVWRDNGDGTFTTINLIDGYSRLDHYIMGLRPPSDVPDTFVITNPSGTSATRESNPFPNVTASGGKQNVTINQIVQANGARNPNSTNAPKSFRAAVVLLTRQGTQASAATLNKVTLFRLAWESYFRQSTDGLATINTGLADLTTARTIAATSAASFQFTLSPGEISALFGDGLSGGTAVATSQPLPTQLAGTQVRINGAFAPLFFVSPTQINFQVPRSTTATTGVVSSSTALVEVISNGQLIRAGAFQIAPATPAIFTLNQSGTGAAAAVDAFTGAREPFNAKQSNGQPNIISVFGTGLGADATDVDGNVNGSAQATIDGAQATVSYAGRTPGFTGLNQFNIIFPANITSGSHTLVISRNGIPGRQVTFAVK